MLQMASWRCQEIDRAVVNLRASCVKQSSPSSRPLHRRSTRGGSSQMSANSCVVPQQSLCPVQGPVHWCGGAAGNVSLGTIFGFPRPGRRIIFLICHHFGTATVLRPYYCTTLHLQQHSIWPCVGSHWLKLERTSSMKLTGALPRAHRQAQEAHSRSRTTMWLYVQ